MKPVSRACCLFATALFLSACSTVSDVTEQLSNLDLSEETYVVRAGETLDIIAYRYAMTPEMLRQMNPGVANWPGVGTRLTVRRSSPSLAAANTQEASNFYIGDRQGGQVREVSTQAVTSPQAIRQSQTVNQDCTDADYYRDDCVVQRGALVADDDLLARAESNEQILSDAEFDQLQSNRIPGTAVPADRRKMRWPIDGEIARTFDPNVPGGEGVDIAGVPGQYVFAAMAGTVVWAGADLSGAGKLVIVEHDDGLKTLYLHAQEVFVSAGETVNPGDTIASLGWNENQESVLGFQVLQRANQLNPLDFLPVR